MQIITQSLISSISPYTYMVYLYNTCKSRNSRISSISSYWPCPRGDPAGRREVVDAAGLVDGRVLAQLQAAPGVEGHGAAVVPRAGVLQDGLALYRVRHHAQGLVFWNNNKYTQTFSIYIPSLFFLGSIPSCLIVAK